MGGLSRARRHLVWGCVAVAYLIVFPYFARLNNPNENVRVWMSRAIAVHGTMAIDEVEREWGEVSDRAAFAGHRYSSKAPGASLLGVPVVWLQARLWGFFGASPSPRLTTYALRICAVALPLIVFFGFFARALPEGPRDLLTVALGLGTMMYPYGLIFAGHALAAALCFSGYLALRGQRRVLAGVLVGLAVVFEYQAIFVAGALAIYAVIRDGKSSLKFFAGALGPALLLGAYHTALFGRPWASPLAYSDDPIFLEYHRRGLGLPRPDVLWAALFGSDNGLFVYSPVLLAGLAVAVWLIRRERREGLLIVGLTMAMLLLLAGVANWRAGWSAGGPRYVCVVVPFLIWALALGWNDLPRWARAATAGTVIASVLLCVLSGAHFPHYPLQLDNPLFDLTLPFIARGYIPYGLGWLLGLPGPVAYLPLALVVGTALAWGLRGQVRGRMTALTVAVAVLLVAGLAVRGRPADQHALEVVRSVWEPDGPR